MDHERRGDTADRRARWTDDRVDDLAKIVEKNDERLDAVQNLLAAHDLQLVEADRDKRLRVTQVFNIRVALISIVLTVFLGEIATIVTILVSTH